MPLQGIIKLKCAPTSPSPIKCQNWRWTGVLGFKGIKNKHSYLTRMMWCSQENTIEPKQTRVSVWQSKGMMFSVSQGQIQSECVSHLINSFKPSQKGQSHHDWQGNAPSCFNQSPQPAHRISESPAVTPEGFWKSAQNKEQEQVSNNGTATSEYQNIFLISAS